MTKTEHRRQATNHILADLSREFWPHVDLDEELATDTKTEHKKEDSRD